jgi:hypothetical protein
MVCTWNTNLGSFWLTVKKQYTIKEISIYSNHIMAAKINKGQGCKDLIFKGDVVNLISAVSSHRINYKFIYILLNIWWGFFLRIPFEQSTKRDNSNFTKT